MAKLTRVVDGRRRIVSDPPLLVPLEQLLPAETDRAALRVQLAGLIATYRQMLETDRRYLLEQFEFADMARKVVGVGSVGTRCWIVVMHGRDEGQRVIAGQRLMQAASDIFLGWQRTEADLDTKQRDYPPAAPRLEILP